MLSNKLTLQQTLIATSICALLTGCGGSGSGSSTNVNTAPIVSVVDTLNLLTLEEKKISITAKDAENDILSYSIKSAPKMGQATIDSKTGVVTYRAGNVVGEDSFIVAVTDGRLTTDVTITVNTQLEAEFAHQFYKVLNPETGNFQVVRYNPNTNKEDVFPSISNVILGNKVFVMSAAKDGDQTVYKKREYAIFLDPNAKKEVRQYKPDGSSSAVEYTFYTDNILKRFDAVDPNKQETIFSSQYLPQKMKAEGAKVIGDSQHLYLNETDIDNSYVELRAFEKLPDTFKGELVDDIKNSFITVRLSDGKVTQGRTIKPIIDNVTGKTDGVLVNYSALHSKGNYPSASTEVARLQKCTVDLSSCTDIKNATGQFYFIAENDTYIYLAREGVKTLYAFHKNDQTITEVKGASYPAKFDPIHHQLKFGGGHGGSGIFSNFYNMPNVVDHLSEGNISYFLVNYNLDTQDAAIQHPFYGNAYVYKNAQILKFDGLVATKIYENGTGTDLGNASDAIPLSYNLTLTAAKNGYLFVEAAKLSKEKLNLNYQQGWINTSTTSPKNELDHIVTDQDINYFTALRVPAVAVGQHIYVNETTGKNTETDPRVYNIYKLSLDTPNAAKQSVTPTSGRMYFERSAYRSNGVYEGNVLLWDKNKNGLITNATNNKVMGSSIDVDAGVTNVTADASGNVTLAGVGGLFGLHMTGSHGAVPFLTSGFSEKENSLKKVNQINGAWITD